MQTVSESVSESVSEVALNVGQLALPIDLPSDARGTRYRVDYADRIGAHNTSYFDAADDADAQTVLVDFMSNRYPATMPTLERVTGGRVPVSVNIPLVSAPPREHMRRRVELKLDPARIAEAQAGHDHIMALFAAARRRDA